MNKKKAILGIFIVSIMIISVFGFVLSYQTGESSGANYNKHKFKVLNNKYITKIDKQEYTFYYHPTDLEFLNINQDFLQHPMYTITFDPNVTDLQYVEIARFNLAETLRKKGIAFQHGILKENKNYDLPLLGCEQNIGPVIIFKTGNTTKFEQTGNCLFAKARTGPEFIRLSERIQYGLLGVING